MKKPVGMLLTAALAISALMLSACGGDDDDATKTDTVPSGASSAAATTAPTTALSGAPPTSSAAAGSAVQVKDTSIGKVLAASDGRTLYTFNNDTTGKSNCNGSCASTWPPLTATSAPVKLEGVAGDFSLVNRDDGQKQLALNGKPLYRYAADGSSADTKGEGVGGVWFAAKAAATATSSTSPVPNPSDNGY